MARRGASGGASRAMMGASASADTGEVVLLDFWAEWCGACRLIAPVIERIVARDPNITLEKINVAEAADKAAEMNVTGLPTLIIQGPCGRELQRLTGTLSGRRIEEAVAMARAAL